jgi:hypothetical protein
MNNFSSTFDKELKIDMCLLLKILDFSPFLNKGLTTAYFKRSGKIPEDIDLLHICIRGELIKGELIFINLVDIPSYPEELLSLRDFIMLSISLVDINFKLISGNGFLKDCIK